MIERTKILAQSKNPQMVPKNIRYIFTLQTNKKVHSSKSDIFHEIINILIAAILELFPCLDKTTLQHRVGSIGHLTRHHIALLRNNFKTDIYSGFEIVSGCIGKQHQIQGHPESERNLSKIGKPGVKRPPSCLFPPIWNIKIDVQEVTFQHGSTCT